MPATPSSTATSRVTTSGTPAREDVRFEPGDIVLCSGKPVTLLREMSTKGKWEISWFGYPGSTTRKEKDFLALHKDDRIKEPNSDKDKEIFRAQMPQVLESLEQTVDGWGSRAGRTRDAGQYLLVARAAAVYHVNQRPPVRVEVANAAEAQVPVVSARVRGANRKRAAETPNGRNMKRTKQVAEQDAEQDAAEDAGQQGWLSAFGQACKTATSWVGGLFGNR